MRMREIIWQSRLNGHAGHSIAMNKAITHRMKTKSKNPTWLSTLILSGLGIWVSPGEVLTRTSEVERALNPVLSSYEVRRFEPGERERQIRTTGDLRFRFHGTDFHFNLKPHNMRAPNYRAVETGPGGVRRTLPHPTQTDRWHLPGRNWAATGAESVVDRDRKAPIEGFSGRH